MDCMLGIGERNRIHVPSESKLLGSAAAMIAIHATSARVPHINDCVGTALYHTIPVYKYIYIYLYNNYDDDKQLTLNCGYSRTFYE